MSWTTRSGVGTCKSIVLMTCCWYDIVVEQVFFPKAAVNNISKVKLTARWAGKRHCGHALYLAQLMGNNTAGSLKTNPCMGPPYRMHLHRSIATLYLGTKCPVAVTILSEQEYNVHLLGLFGMQHHLDCLVHHLDDSGIQLCTTWSTESKPFPHSYRYIFHTIHVKSNFCWPLNITGVHTDIHCTHIFFL